MHVLNQQHPYNVRIKVFTYLVYVFEGPCFSLVLQEKHVRFFKQLLMALLSLSKSPISFFPKIKPLLSGNCLSKT